MSNRESEMHDYLWDYDRMTREFLGIPEQPEEVVAALTRYDGNENSQVWYDLAKK